MTAPNRRAPRNAPEGDGTKKNQLEAFWGDVSDLEPIFVDNLHFGKLNDQFYLTFGQMRLPVATTSDETLQVEIKPMVRVVVTPQALARFLDLLSRAVAK